MTALQARMTETLAAAFPDATQLEVTSTDGVHFSVRVVSPQFVGISLLKRHQRVYQLFGPWLTSGELHAVALHTHTPEEVAAHG